MRIIRLGLLLAAALLLDNCDDNNGMSLGSGSGSSSKPITAPADTWTWVPFDNAYCANGTTTGIGVNLHAGATRMLIYLEGGGACWSQETCYVLDTAVNLSGYGPTQFQTESTDTTYLALPGGFFDRSAETGAGNPFQNYSYVYVPYCTGDVFAGDNTLMYGTTNTMQVGYANMTAFLKRIVPTAAGMDRIVLAGSSAGGFGATFNLAQAQQAFGSTRVDLIDDSGTPMPADIMAQSSDNPQSLWFQNWNLAATLPSGCTNCGTDLSTIFSYYATALPNSRIALLSYSQDTVLPSYFSITTALFTQGLQEVAMDDFDPDANLKYFVDDASGHVLWFTPTLAYNSTSVQTFLTNMESDSGTWSSVSPCGYVSAGGVQPRC